MVNNLVCGGNQDKVSENLFKTYSNYSNYTAGDFFCNLRQDSRLYSYPHWCVVLPWEEIMIEDLYKTYPDNLLRNRSLNGVNYEKNSSSEHIISKSMSYSAAVSQVNQTFNLLNIIKANLLRIENRLPVATIFYEDSNNWCWQMGGEGNHRAYLLNELGYSKLYCEIEKIVFLSEVENWPNVKSGLFSKQEAIAIFRQVMIGSSPIRSII